MQQSELKDLLEEASKPECSKTRIAHILGQLMDAVSDVVYANFGKNFQTTAQHDAFVWYVRTLFYETATRHPEMLPNLFPAFSLICGDANGIDWALLNEKD